MTKLSGTQAIILSAAAQREDRNILPLPGSLRGGAAAKVVDALLTRGLIAEATTNSRTRAGAALNRVWRNDEDGRAILVHITDAGLAAIGVEPEEADRAPTSADEAPSKEPGPDTSTGPEATPKASTPRTGTKLAKLIDMLRAPNGATIKEIMAATGWQSHTVRGAMAGTLKKKLGLTITSERVDGPGRCYRIVT